MRSRAVPLASPARTTVNDLTESELIARISGALPPPPDWMVVGIGDDAAVVEPERNRLEVLSVDALVDGVHFDRTFVPPAAIGYRALAVNLSDLAAMGATPRLALLSLVMPAGLPLADFDGLIEGFTALARQHRVTLAGGNLTRSPGPLVVDVTVLGTVKRRSVLTRKGASPGDLIYVSGTIGGAAAGLQMLQRAPEAGATTASPCVQRYLYPEPRIRLGSLVGRNRAAAACMDLSDGLADAVRQVGAASEVGATIDAESLPVHPDAHRWFKEQGLDADAVTETITASDDYELLIVCRPRTRGRLAAALRHGDAPLTLIGSCTADRALLVRQGGVERALPRGYHHFR